VGFEGRLGEARSDWLREMVLALIILSRASTWDHLYVQKQHNVRSLQTYKRVIGGSSMVHCLSFLFNWGFGHWADGIACVGRFHGDCRNSRKRDNANGYGLWIRSWRSWIELYRSKVLRRRLWSGGRGRCRLSRKWFPRINTPFLTGKRRSIGRAYAVSYLD
jgi:hypothetical protein